MKHRKIGIRLRLFFEVGAIIAVAFAVLALVNSQLLETVYTINMERTLRTIASEAERYDGDITELLSEFEQEKGVSIDLYDNSDNFIYEGSLIYISGSKLNIVSRKENSDGSYFNVVAIEGAKTQYIVFGKDFENGYHIEISIQTDPIRENAELGSKVTVVISSLALFASLIFISGYARRFTKPLIKMSEITSEMAELDFTRKCDIDRHDEIGALAENINVLSDSLSTSLEQLRETNKQLVLDIEQERKLEKMRKDFVSTASHELKTPIAIIRGYAEGLKMTLDPENAGALEYCDIIMNETDKMNQLVLNMLEDSLYSSGSKEPVFEKFSLKSFIDGFVVKTKPIFREKEISASCECDPDIFVFADVTQSETALSNLVSNACSHASGKKTVRIFVEHNGGNYRICVYNSGSHVDEKDKDLIFTSFYRADKAHSRKEGRFGLGLSIVDSIVKNHGTSCGFYNTDDGVVFWFELPEYSQTTERINDEN